ncbi:MAG: hypothetical protein Q7K43_03945, partial [Candidatus Woesearchaeota archaeon]|nr:hypothetical protein [Candidatus Woesearchaeota archaeon]
MPDTIEQDLECLLEIQKKIEENKRPVVSQTEIDKILNAVKTHSHKKELALEPFSPGQTWGVRVLRIDQQPPGMPPEVQAVLSVSSLDLPRGCPLTNFWP